MVTVYQLEQELLREKQSLKATTTYRQQTAELSLQVLKTVQDTAPFFNRTDAQKVVSAVLRSANKHRQLDVAKMLHVLFVQMNNHENYSAEFQHKLAARKRNRGRVSLIFTKKTE
ncbi:hypothetical protein DV702_14525 [Sporosarcina sp. PTS2304]|uniref:hypothetical protein n=1 Tax=Sporosarcina sp. PTS2304 TaxID=2283194 RepID=UPI000E0D4F97|nr:hypothetical protein [Sporosarcina sp. PTS2304]AXI00814.1 hypothetical protein DV702_14525 [Sporosarcina sp. PTS2304]